MNCVYFAAKIVIMMVDLAIKGLIYNKIYCCFIATPTIIGFLASVILGIFVQSPLITINFINLELEISKVIILWIITYY